MSSFDKHYIFLRKNARQFFLLHISANLSFFTVCYHFGKWSYGNMLYFKYAYLQEHSAFEKNLSFGHQVILPLKHFAEKI